MNGSKRDVTEEFTPGIAIFHDKYWSAQWLVICGLCNPSGSVQPFGDDEAAARTWAATHQQAHVTDPLRNGS